MLRAARFAATLGFGDRAADAGRDRRERGAGALALRRTGARGAPHPAGRPGAVGRAPAGARRPACWPRSPPSSPASGACRRARCPARTCGTTPAGPSTPCRSLARDEPPLLRLAALLHDVGKPATFADGHFVGHETVGASLAEAWLTELHAPRFLTDGHREPGPPPHVRLRPRLDRCRGAPLHPALRRVGSRGPARPAGRRQRRERAPARTRMTWSRSGRAATPSSRHGSRSTSRAWPSTGRPDGGPRHPGRARGRLAPGPPSRAGDGRPDAQRPFAPAHPCSRAGRRRAAAEAARDASPASDGDRSRVIEQLLRAENALSLGLLDQAEQIYAQTLAHDPVNAIALVGLSRVALERGDERASLVLARRARGDRSRECTGGPDGRPGSRRSSASAATICRRMTRPSPRSHPCRRSRRACRPVPIQPPRRTSRRNGAASCAGSPGGPEMRVLVTGGAGYVGSVSVEALVAAGHDVLVLDDLSKGHRDALPAGVRLVQGSYGDPSTVAPLLASTPVDAVLHCAARSLVGESIAGPGALLPRERGRRRRVPRGAAPGGRAPARLQLHGRGVRDACAASRSARTRSSRRSTRTARRSERSRARCAGTRLPTGCGA